jgi:uncharacterized membrane protein YraQ (UPF0718 family)
MITPTVLIFWLIVLVLGVIAYTRPVKVHLQGIMIAWEFSLSMFPRILMAVLVAGFFSVLVPADLIATWIGKESGLKGILIASMVGGFIPGGPIICFPLVLIFIRAGAGLAPLMALLTAWSVFAFNRILAFEIPLMGARFAGLRILSSLCLPPLAGILTGLIETYLWRGM